MIGPRARPKFQLEAGSLVVAKIIPTRSLLDSKKPVHWFDLRKSGTS